MHSTSKQPIVTRPPCDGTDRRTCPFYWHPPEENYYDVFVNGIQTFVIHNQLPSKCANNVTVNNKIVNCARHWSVKTQSFTSVAFDFEQGDKVHVTVRTHSGYLRSKPLIDPKVVSRFNHGNATATGLGFGEFNFSVAEPGHYSVELFGRSDHRDALLLFIDDASGVTTAHCPEPSGNGTLYHYTGPGVANSQVRNCSLHVPLSASLCLSLSFLFLFFLFFL